MADEEFVYGDRRYRKSPYAPPAAGTLYVVRDKSKGDRVIEVVAVTFDGTHVDVLTLDGEGRSAQPVRLAVESLALQAERGWCHVLVPADSEQATGAVMRLDVQNFSRCSADIARANIRFDTQLIKDIADGPFRAGNYQQAFVMFEQIAVGFVSAVAGSRRTIADGRRALVAQKGNLSGKEIEERKAAFVRSEQLIGAAERSFTTILEGLRMYLRNQSASE